MDVFSVALRTIGSTIEQYVMRYEEYYASCRHKIIMPPLDWNSQVCRFSEVVCCNDVRKVALPHLCIF